MSRWWSLCLEKPEVERFKNMEFWYQDTQGPNKRGHIYLQTQVTHVSSEMGSKPGEWERMWTTHRRRKESTGSWHSFLLSWGQCKHFWFKDDIFGFGDGSRGFITTGVHAITRVTEGNSIPSFQNSFKTALIHLWYACVLCCDAHVVRGVFVKLHSFLRPCRSRSSNPHCHAEQNLYSPSHFASPSFSLRFLFSITSN